MILWEESKNKFGTVENCINKKSKLWFKCDNCGSEYEISHKTNLERIRCNRNKCRFCANKVLTDEQRKHRSSHYVKKSRDKTGRDVLYKRFLIKKEKSVELFVASKVYGSLNEDKRNSRECDITRDFVLGMLERQDYRCKLSGISLTHMKSLDDMSIDRIDNNFGHTRNNIQLICRGLNIAKNRHTNEDIVEFLDCLCGKRRFVPDKTSRDYISSIRRNNHQRDKGKGINCNLTTDMIIEMFERQNGLCVLSGLPIACYQHPCFSVSIDRIDNSIGHNMNNIQLVLKCINRAKSKFSNDQVIEWLDNIRRSYGTND